GGLQSGLLFGYLLVGRHQTRVDLPVFLQPVSQHKNQQGSHADSHLKKLPDAALLDILFDQLSFSSFMGRHTVVRIDMLQIAVEQADQLAMGLGNGKIKPVGTRVFMDGVNGFKIENLVVVAFFLEEAPAVYQDINLAVEHGLVDGSVVLVVQRHNMGFRKG